VVSIDESPDESEVLTAGRDGAIRVWPQETVTEAFAESLVLGAHPGVEAAFSPDGTRLVGAGTDGRTRVWDTSTGQELLTIHLPPFASGFPTADYDPDPDQHHVVTGGSGGTPLQIWDIDSGQRIRLLRGASSTKLVRYSPDGTRIAAAVGYHILVWDAKSGEELARIEHSAEAGLAFSPDGSKIAFSATRNYDDLGICDAETGALLKTLKKGGGAGFRTVTF
jgi:WD40 repeat protein